MQVKIDNWREITYEEYRVFRLENKDKPYTVIPTSQGTFLISYGYDYPSWDNLCKPR